MSARYRLVESTIPGQLRKQETSLFDGVDTSLNALIGYVQGQPPRVLHDSLAQIGETIKEATAQLQTRRLEATLPALAKGLSIVRALRTQLANLELNDGARFEIDGRLALKEADFQRALVLAARPR